MKFLNIVFLATSAAALAVDTRSLHGRNRVDHEAAILARHNVDQGRQGFGGLFGGGFGGSRNGGIRGGNRGGDQGGVIANPGNNTVPNENGGNAITGDDTTDGDDATAGDDTAAGGDTNTIVVTGETLVLKEINGVPGNECLTFRNNGEIVDAACVNEAADRQMTPATLDGAPVLRVQRSFAVGFRPDLVGVEACVGFNGTHFRAEDCAAPGIELVQFDGTSLRAPGGACASGHDDLAQVTVDPTGAACAQFDATAVTPTAP